MQNAISATQERKDCNADMIANSPLSFKKILNFHSNIEHGSARLAVGDKGKKGMGTVSQAFRNLIVSASRAVLEQPKILFALFAL